MRKCSKPDGNKTWAGKRIAELRQERGMSQNDLAIQLQKCGLDVDKKCNSTAWAWPSVCTRYGVVSDCKDFKGPYGGFICGRSDRFKLKAVAPPRISSWWGYCYFRKTMPNTCPAKNSIVFALFAFGGDGGSRTRVRKLIRTLSTSVSGLLGFPSAPAVRQADAYGSLQVMTGEEAIPCSRSLLIDAQI